MGQARLGLLAWAAGVLAYVVALGVIYGEWMSPGDAGAVLLTSFVASQLCYRLVYLPVLRLVRRGVPAAWARWAYPVVAVLLGLLPTALVARYWGGSLRSLATPEALLFYVLFATVGLVVGVGFTRLDSRR